MDMQLVSLQTALVGEGFPTGLTEEIEFQFCLLFTNILFSQVNFPKIENCSQYSQLLSVTSDL